MHDPAFRLARITLASINIPATVAFYDAVFAADLQPTAAYGTTLYTGNIAGLRLLICPNELAGVQADQSRHQLRFEVADLADTLRRAQAAGGVVEPSDMLTATNAVVRDPDGNSIEFIQTTDNAS